MESLRTLFSRVQSKPRLYVDALRFDPGQERKNEAWIIFARDEVENIFDRVSALCSSGGVIVVDQGSTDGTPYFAAEAGAIVVMQEAGQPREVALQEAIRVAKRIARNVYLCE